MTFKGKPVICRARLLYTLADLPAKASLTNMMQYNGRFGCPTCKMEGEQVHYFEECEWWWHVEPGLCIVTETCFVSFRFLLGEAEPEHMVTTQVHYETTKNM